MYSVWSRARQLFGTSLWCVFITLTESAPAAPPPEAYGTMPIETDVVLSPSGQHLAWIDHKDAKPTAIIFDLGTKKVVRAMAVPERNKLRSLQWVDDETILITVSAASEAKRDSDRPREVYKIVAHDASGGDGRMLMTDPKGARLNGVLISAHTAKPKTVVMAAYHAYARDEFLSSPIYSLDLYEVDTRTCRASVIKRGNRSTAGWVVDRTGNPVAREDWDWRSHTYQVVALHGEAVREIFRQDASSQPQLEGLLPDGSGLVLLATRGHPHQAAWVLPLDGSAPTVLAEDPTPILRAPTSIPTPAQSSAFTSAAPRTG